MKKLLVFLFVGIFFLFGFHEVSADCGEFSLSYDSASVCSKTTKNAETAKSKETTVLRLFDMRNPFNEGDPIVFVGKLATKSGVPIPNSKITIVHDGPCAFKTIGEGKTDKTGRFWILATAKIWDERDNLVKTHATYGGEEKFLSSTSEYKVIVVLPVQNKSCFE